MFMATAGAVGAISSSPLVHRQTLAMIVGTDRPSRKMAYPPPIKAAAAVSGTRAGSRRTAMETGRRRAG
jgi:hypothetical protein